MVSGSLFGNSMKNQYLKSFELILRVMSVSTFIALGALPLHSSANSQESFNLQNSRWRLRIMPARLGVWGKPFGATQEITLASPADQADQIDGIRVSRDSLSWNVPGKELRVEARLSESGLSIRFTTTREQTLEWPTTGADPRALAAI